LPTRIIGTNREDFLASISQNRANQPLAVARYAGQYAVWEPDSNFNNSMAD
jgi:hypothetical protein